jgi:hypothetical protein
MQSEMVEHLNRKEKTKTVRKITEWNSIGMRFKGCPKRDGEMRSWIWAT